MRYLILSDIHANITALEAALEAAKGRWEQAVCLGDIVGYGPDPNEAVDRVRALGCVTIRGNHDKAIAGIIEGEEFNPVAREAVMWTRERLTDDNLKWLRGLRQGPVIIEDFGVVHGSVHDEDEYVFVAQQAFIEMQLAATPVTFFGHTHRQGGFMARGSGMGVINFDPTPKPIAGRLQIEEGVQYFLHPGSIGQPRDGDARAAFVIFDTDTKRVEYWRVRYEIAAVQERMAEALLPEALILRLSVGR
jgi:predicted phosphodiesterase